MDARREAARRTALLILGRRSCSSRRLFEKLREKGYDERDAAEAVAWCLEQRFLDDEALCRRVIEQKTERRYGARRIRDDLRSKGFDAELIDRVLEEAEAGRDAEEDRERLETLCRKLHRDGPWDRREKARVSAALSRRGFNWDEIRSAMRSVTENAE